MRKPIPEPVEPLDRIETLRVQLLAGLMRRDNRIWQSRRAVEDRVVDPSEITQPWNNGAPRYVSDGGLDDYFSCGRTVR